MRALALDHGVVPAEVRLEVTETWAIEDAGAAAAALQRLRRAGFGLVMDDFGAGHSTLSRLAHLPFDAVKIDASFLIGGPATRGVLSGLIRLAHDLGLDATAEGVESDEDLAFLEAAGCPYAQGFHCGRPADAAATQRLFAALAEPVSAEE
ncbi:MAG: EAL domain-containing protein [Alphaproteobacteria bacterium]